MAWGEDAAEQYEKDQPSMASIPKPEELKHSGESLIRAYALGHAHGHHRLTPNEADWTCARNWYGG